MQIELNKKINKSFSILMSILMSDFNIGQKVLKILGMAIILLLVVTILKSDFNIVRETSVYQAGLLTRIVDDFDDDGIFEEVKFELLSPEEFDHITRIYFPSKKFIDIYGSFSMATVLDLNNNGIKELIMRVDAGKLFGFFVFAYEGGNLRQLPTYNNLPDPYEGIWGIAPMKFLDIDNDGFVELVVNSADYFSEDHQSSNWYSNIFEYYRWNGVGFEKYKEEVIKIKPSNG